MEESLEWGLLAYLITFPFSFILSIAFFIFIQLIEKNKEPYCKTYLVFICFIQHISIFLFFITVTQQKNGNFIGTLVTFSLVTTSIVSILVNKAFKTTFTSSLTACFLFLAVYLALPIYLNN